MGLKKIISDLFVRSIIENKQLCYTNVWFVCRCCIAWHLVL